VSKGYLDLDGDVKRILIPKDSETAFDSFWRLLMGFNIVPSNEKQLSAIANEMRRGVYGRINPVIYDP
jgi:hypothetical protein